MKTLFAIILAFAAALTASSQTGAEKSDWEIATQKAITELRAATSELTVLHESNKKLARSNQSQSDTTKMLDKQQHKIQYEDWPVLSNKIDELNAKIERIRASGCPEERTEVVVELANRCNPLNAETKRERAALALAQDNMNGQIQNINQTRRAVYTTTQENAAQQKKNNAAIEVLQTRKLALYSQLITRSTSIAGSRELASKACQSLPLEKAHCCLSVVNDAKDPAQCGLESLFTLFENAGVFAITEVKPLAAVANPAVILPTRVVVTWSGNWDKQDTALVHAALLGVKDEGLRNWISANVQFNRAKPDGVSPLSVNGSILKFKDDFFTKATSAQRENLLSAQRENLLAFEAGKAFWNITKDKSVEGNKSLMTWFAGFSAAHGGVIADMKAAKHGVAGFGGLGDIDAPSQFAYIFRAQALQLNKPKGHQEWDEVIREFRTRIDRFLRDK